MEEVLVTGEFPGPGLWKVTPDGESTHALWIVADPFPWPDGWRWKSRDIEDRLLDSQALLLDAGVTVTTDEKVGVLRGLTLLPSLLKARRNPDEARLKDRVPPAVYTRWQAQKQRYLGRDAGIENWRPLFAADKLRRAALDKLDYVETWPVQRALEKLARKHDIAIESPLLKFEFKRDELRQRIRDFSRESLADLDCFTVTLDLTEALARQDIEHARARAWSRGDVAAMRALPALPSPALPCATAVLSAQVTQDLVPADVRERVALEWVSVAERLLASHASTLAVVPFDKLTRAGGYLDRLRARGYRIEEPL